MTLIKHWPNEFLSPNIFNNIEYINRPLGEAEIAQFGFW